MFSLDLTCYWDQKPRNKMKKNAPCISKIVAVASILAALLTPHVALSDATTAVDSEASTTMNRATTHQRRSNQFWWPDQLDLSPLRNHDARSNPLGADFDYAQAFA